tara:strand:+ start:6151 stop:9126 length:2976 start_codon:yes stop_codon:yes gene_type:complete
MSVKSFKFVSPGVFINEIDNSFRPRSSEAIGPVVIGRATRGLALQPIKVQSYSEFVEVFGDTVPGNQGGDVTRRGNFNSPMYGTYASKAFLAANVAPLTYIRLLGAEHPQAETAGKAGWDTSNTADAAAVASQGGAFGLFVFPNSTYVSESATTPGTGSLAAVWYCNSGAQVQLSGAYWSDRSFLAGSGTADNSGIGMLLKTDSNNLFTVNIKSSGGTYDETIKFGFNDNKDSFIRDKFNTNPALTSDAGTYYDSTAHKPYWLGESYELTLRDKNLVDAAALGVIYPLALSSSITTGPHARRLPSQEARAGWFIGQDLSGDPSTYVAEDAQKLFRLIGRGHGEWLQKNCKVSIEKIRQSTSTTDDFGTFSVVIRQLQDTDNRVIVLERFDNCNLNPASPNYVARKIGDTYHEWNNQERKLRRYGSYPNMSKYVYVDMNTEVEAGATNTKLIPFGYYGPPRYRSVNFISNSAGGSCCTVPATSMVRLPSGAFGTPSKTTGDALLEATRGEKFRNAFPFMSIGDALGVEAPRINASFEFPIDRLRVSGSDGGLSDQKNAYYGFMNTRSKDTTRHDDSVADMHRLLDSRMAQTVDNTVTAVDGVQGFSYIFTLNDIRAEESGANHLFYYESGSHKEGDSYSSASYERLLDQRVNRFTAPFFGGFDGLDVMKPDPFASSLMDSTKTERNSSAFFTVRRAIDTVADPESVDMNLLTMPGLTSDALTVHMTNVCEDRGDAMSLVDLAGIYTPNHESYSSTFSGRLGAGAEAVANALKNRRLDTSYGATFYPWVQTLDEPTSQLVWIPPSVAMMGVLASSQARSHLWFAPAGFNRGGLSDGAAGIPITNVTERLTSKDRDVLYEAKINPIASFPSTGLVVFGQKTLQERASALDRINVRRLVIFLKKQISILSTQVLFEQNVQTTWNRFKGLVEPFLSTVKTQYGITDYKLILDETTTTPDLIDQNIMYAKIMVKPARAIEYIAIDFVIASTGASFED